MKKWVYKVNSKIGRRHFDQYFSYRGKKAFTMGGSGWIRSPQSWANLRRVRKGDLFLCFQTDERKIYGLTYAASDGYEVLPGSGRFNCVDFAPCGQRLREPLNVAKHRALFSHVRAFTVPSRGTIHPLAEDEWRAIRKLLDVKVP